MKKAFMKMFDQEKQKVCGGQANIASVSISQSSTSDSSPNINNTGDGDVNITMGFEEVGKSKYLICIEQIEKISDALSKTANLAKSADGIKGSEKLMVGAILEGKDALNEILKSMKGNLWK